MLDLETTLFISKWTILLFASVKIVIFLVASKKQRENLFLLGLFAARPCAEAIILFRGIQDMNSILSIRWISDLLGLFFLVSWFVFFMKKK
jgi:hypothetical protein